MSCARLPGGEILRVKDVARVELGAQNYNVKARLNGKPSALIALYQLPDSNAVDAANGAKKVMEKLKQSFPPDLDYVVALDTTLAVTEGMKDIEHTLVEAIILVIIVVFIFLQGWRATLIPLLAVPVSLVGTFALFPLFGFSINTLSLFGLVLAIGLVVDDAIVVVEIVEHHIEKGLSPQRRGAERNAGSFRAGHGHRDHPRGGVCADGVYSRHHRTTLPAVRRYCRGIRRDLRVQRAYTFARARGDAAASQG